MRETEFIENKYEGFITYDTETKKITKIHCSCWNFANKRLKAVGKGYNKKVIETPCKHLQEKYNNLLLEGYTYREVNTGEGLDKITPALKKKILEVWGNKCFYHKCYETNNLEFHRLIRGHQGGGYSILNTRPLCNFHHKVVHGKEFT